MPVSLRRFLLSLLLSVLLALFAVAPAAAAEVWYQDNSFGKGGVLPDDFAYKFEHPESWNRALQELDVYLFRANVFRMEVLSDAFITNVMMPVLAKQEIKYAIDSGAAMFSACRNRDARIDFELESMARIRRLGIKVSYVALQSILSKPHDKAGLETECALEDRIRGGINYARKFRTIYPEAQFGIIDALPAHGKAYREAYRTARDLFSAAGIPLKFINLDISADQVFRGDHGLTWSKILEVERSVEGLGLDFGIYLKSRRAGHVSDQEFFATTIRAADEFLEHCGSAGHYIISSWFPYPKRSVKRPGEPEGGTPITDAIHELAGRIDSYETGKQRCRQH